MYHSVGHRQFCPNMKRITLNNIVEALEQKNNQVTIEDQLFVRANIALTRMLERAK